MKGAYVLVSLAVLGVASGASAQEASDHESRPVIRAVRVERSITIDGRLDEAPWRTPAGATEFTQRDPQEGKPSTQRTEIWIAHDESSIYVAARMHDTVGVSTRLGRRDSSLPGSDWLTVSFDSYHDHRSSYEFSVNPSGVRRDLRIASGEEDESWDPVWDAAARTDSTGWTAELRIPLGQLRFPEDDEQSWGVQIVREISRNSEEAYFAFTPKKERSGVPRYGHLTGLQGLRPRSPLELVPYAQTRALYRTIPGDSNPFSDGSDVTAGFGVDLKYRPASNLTLDATINPDFGQVEADPAVINLTAFETFYEERRPFFIEGADIFTFGGGGTQLFYSRRIGEPPQGSVPSAAIYEHSTILGAEKLTGKVGNWSLGVLEAVTARERADYIIEGDDGAPAQRDAIVASPASYFVTRARREFRDGESVVGGMVTALHRSMGQDFPLLSPRDDAVAERVRSSAYSGGFDFTHEWADRSWSLEGFASGSHIRGEPSVIRRAQRSSARYFQRPDADHLRVNEAATTLSGFSSRLSLEKEAGEHWRGEATVSTTSPGFETNDMGFQTRADRHTGEVNVEYVNEQPGRLFREWSLEAVSGADWNYGGNRVATNAGLEFSAELANYWKADIELNRDFSALNDRLTRGGPLAWDPAVNSMALSLESNDRKPWTVELGFERERGDAVSGTTAGVEVKLRPAPSWDLSISAEWERARSAAQFMDSQEDALATHTFGERYVFSDLVETEVSLGVRANVTFTPNLSFELFARPFIGSGEFGRPKELTAPRTFRFASYDEIGTVTEDGDEWVVDPDGAGPAEEFSLDREDFTEVSLRGNAVLRWEWLPGSTMFFLWQQRREHEAEFEDLPLGRADLRLRRELSALGSARPENRFMVKVSYWISP
jgi:hypothetical protein